MDYLWICIPQTLKNGSRNAVGINPKMLVVDCDVLNNFICQVYFNCMGKTKLIWIGILKYNAGKLSCKFNKSMYKLQSLIIFRSFRSRCSFSFDALKFISSLFKQSCQNLYIYQICNKPVVLNHIIDSQLPKQFQRWPKSQSVSHIFLQVDQFKQAFLLLNYRPFISYKLNTMSKNKGKGFNLQKQTPFNINISVNINPKNIVHHQVNSEMKFSHNIFQGTHSLTRNQKKGEANTSQKNQRNFQITQKHNRTSQDKTFDKTQMNKKRLDQMKQSFLSKIASMDINLSENSSQKKQQIQQRDECGSSMMSVKLIPCDQDNVKNSRDELQFNLNRFNGKSKILVNSQISRVLGSGNFKKAKHQSKYSNLSFHQIKSKSKLAVNTRGFSTFTDVKTCVEKNTKKQKHKGQCSQKKNILVKQQNLKDKLQKFKLDMTKLSFFYQENQILKTKFSSELNNILSRELSKEIDILNVGQNQIHQKFKEIRQFQNSNNKQTQQNQQFKKIKDIYQQLNHQAYDNEGKQQTQKLIEHYQNIYDQDQRTTPKEDSYCKQLKEQCDQQKCDKKDDCVQQNQKKQTNSQSLSEFVQYLQSKLQNTQMKNYMLAILNQYQLKNKGIQIPRLKEEDQQDNANIQYESVDEAINKQLEQIYVIKSKLSADKQLQQNDLFHLQNWSYSYREELLKIKTKMWKEYKTISSQIQQRIATSAIQRNIVTCKQKKQKKIMKCISEKLIYKRTNNDSIKIINNKETKKNKNKDVLLLLQQNLFKQTQQQVQQNNQVIDQQQDNKEIQKNIDDMPIDQSSGEQDDLAIESRAILNQIEEGLTKMNQFANKNIIDCKDQAINKLELQTTYLSPKNIAFISTQDKQDIFQFIFLDLCIELYQEALEEEQAKIQNQPKLKSTQRIMQSVRQFAKESKKQKIYNQKRKIGINTSLATVKQFMNQLKKFIVSKQILPKDPSNKIFQKVLSQLNSPLGPTEIQILKSLRLSIFDNQQCQDFNEDLQQQNLLILQPQLFIYFQNQIIKVHSLVFNKYYQSEQKDKQRYNFLRNCTHIYHKCIFDNYSRVYGIWGKPFIWKKVISFQKVIKQHQLQKYIDTAIAETIRSSSFACGLIADRQDSLIKDVANDVYYVQRLQDQRIYKLLEEFVFDMQQKWYFYDDEQTQILIELSHIVWTLLIKEAIKELITLNN